MLAGIFARRRRARKESAVAETTTQSAARDPGAIDVLWITAGLGCDGDSIAMTAATQPSLEDLVLGAIPGVPQVRLHHPVLA